MHDHASQDSLRNSSASSIYLLSSSLSCHLSGTLVQISGCNGDAHDVCTVMDIAFLRRWNAKVCLVATWITKNISPRRTANAMCALVATQTVRGVSGGAANNGHRDRHVIATTHGRFAAFVGLRKPLGVLYIPLSHPRPIHPLSPSMYTHDPPRPPPMRPSTARRLALCRCNERGNRGIDRGLADSTGESGNREGMLRGEFGCPPVQSHSPPLAALKGVGGGRGRTDGGARQGGRGWGGSEDGRRPGVQGLRGVEVRGGTGRGRSARICAGAVGRRRTSSLRSRVANSRPPPFLGFLRSAASAIDPSQRRAKMRGHCWRLCRSPP